MHDKLAIYCSVLLGDWIQQASQRDRLYRWKVACAVPVNDIDSFLLNNGTVILGTTPQSEGVSESRMNGLRNVAPILTNISRLCRLFFED